MHTHLTAWRKFRGMSQETVAEALGVRPSTISRWERGQMKITTADLERLAVLYSCSMSQLISAPDNADMIERLDRAQEIMQHMDTETLDQWLALGRKLAQR